MGCEVIIPARVTCCGQPAWNSGFVGEAASVARTTLSGLADALAGGQIDVVCVPAGSCATMMRVFWVELFELDADHASARRAAALADHVKEFSELLDDLGGTSAFAPATPAGVTSNGPDEVTVYHHSCHMLRELGLRDEPLKALEEAGVAVTNWEGDDRCCGFGGTFSVKQPEISTAMADDKIDAAVAAHATQIVGCDASCLAHLGGRAARRSDNLEVLHLAQVLDTEQGRA